MKPAPGQPGQRALLLAVALLIGAGCATLEPPVSKLKPTEVAWTSSLYRLESLAFKPSTAAGTLLAESGAQRVLVLATRDRKIRGLNSETGETLWTVTTRGPNRARPLAHGGVVYVPSMDGRVYALNVHTGSEIWTSEPVGQGALGTAAVLSQGPDGKARLFVTSSDDRLIALDAETGAYLWDRQRKSPSTLTIEGQAGAAVNESAVFTGFADGTVAAFAQEDGATLWQVELLAELRDFNDVDTTPVLVEDRVVVGGYRAGLHALDAQTGDAIWNVPGDSYGDPLLFEGLLYVPKADGAVVAIHPDRGNVAWKLALKTGTPSKPAASRKYLWIPTGEALLVCDRGTGRVVARVHDEHGFTATPEVAWGTLYAPADSGILYGLHIY